MRNMRKWFIMLSVLSLFFLVGCELETTDNGDLDGYWHLEQVDTLSSQRSVDYGQARIFWSIQFKLLQLLNAELPMLVTLLGMVMEVRPVHM